MYKITGKFGDHDVGVSGNVIGDSAAARAYEGYYAHQDDYRIVKYTDKGYMAHVNPNHIEGVDVRGRFMPFSREPATESPDAFWNMRAPRENHERYLELTSHIPEINDMLFGKSREEQERIIRELRSDERLGSCATYCFAPEHRIEVMAMGDFYEMQGNGRHRTLAARENMEMARQEALEKGIPFDKSRYTMPVQVVGALEYTEEIDKTPIDRPSPFRASHDVYRPEEPAYDSRADAKLSRWDEEINTDAIESGMSMPSYVERYETRRSVEPEMDMAPLGHVERYEARRSAEPEMNMSPSGDVVRYEARGSAEPEMNMSPSGDAERYETRRSTEPEMDMAPPSHVERYEARRSAEPEMNMSPLGDVERYEARRSAEPEMGIVLPSHVERYEARRSAEPEMDMAPSAAGREDKVNRDVNGANADGQDADKSSEESMNEESGIT